MLRINCCPKINKYFIYEMIKNNKKINYDKFYKSDLCLLLDVIFNDYYLVKKNDTK